MEECCKIQFKNSIYVIHSMVDFASEQEKGVNAYTIVTEEMPKGLLTDITKSSVVKAKILTEEIIRPSCRIKARFNKESGKLEYTIMISEKGE